jgi:hypothetical protein
MEMHQEICYQFKLATGLQANKDNARDFFQDYFGNMTHTHGIGNFSSILLKLGKNA